MKEQTLANAIDKLATQKAERLLRDMRDAVNNALKPYWRHKDASEAFHQDDIKAVLSEYVALIGSCDKHYKVKPTAELVNNCRAQIVNELLNGLPKLRELALMAEANENAETTKFFNDRHDARVAAGNQPLGGGEA